MQAYSILQFFLNDRVRSIDIYRHLSLAHSTLQEPNQWAFNPVRDMRSSLGYVGLRNMGCTCYMNR